jgi:ElaB/YqjD/DUF883 family membrane-anchored ribosome-binding protein
MNTNPFDELPQNTLADGTREAARRTSEAAQDALRKTTEATQNALRKTGEVAQQALHRTSEAAQATYQSARTGCEHTLSSTRTYVQKNPLPAVIGAFALGAVISLVLANTRRHEPTLRERLLDDPLDSIRETIFAALAPVGKRLHHNYDSARDTAGEALERAQENASSWGKQLRRASHNLKFW